MFLPDPNECGIIDAHMHPYLAKDRNFPFAVPETYEEFFAEQRRAGITMSCGSFNIINDGTGFPVVNPGMDVAGVFFEHLTETERKMVLRENFLRLTGYSL